MRKLIFASLVAVSSLLPTLSRADSLHDTNSEASLMVSFISVVIPIYSSAQASVAFNSSMDSAAANKTPIIVTKLEEQENGYLLEAKAGDTPITLQVKGKELARADVKVGTELQVLKTKSSYVLEKNDIAIGVISYNPDLFKQLKLN